MSGFVIDEKEYEIPTFDTFDLDEAELFFNNCGFPIEDLVLAGLTDEEVSVKFRSPAVIRTLMQVAYQRGNPEMPAAEADARLRKSNYADALAAVLRVDDTEEDADPLIQAETTDSGSSSASSNDSSGESSETSSDEPGIPLAATGTTG